MAQDYEFTENDRILVEWHLKAITIGRDKLNEGQLIWAIRMEEAYAKFGKLSPRQQEILQRLYDACN